MWTSYNIHLIYSHLLPPALPRPPLHPAVTDPVWQHEETVRAGRDCQPGLCLLSSIMRDRNQKLVRPDSALSNRFKHPMLKKGRLFNGNVTFYTLFITILLFTILFFSYFGVYIVITFSTFNRLV